MTTLLDLPAIGNPWADRDSRYNAADDIGKAVRQGRTNMNTYALALEQACNLFRDFADGKIKSVSFDDLNMNIVKGAFNFGLDVIDQFLPGGETLCKLGKLVYGKAKAHLRETLTKPVESLKGEVSAETLSKFVNELAKSGKKIPMSWHTNSSGALQKMEESAVRLQNRLKVDRRDLTDDEKVLLDCFYDADIAEVDACLQYYYGVPRPENTPGFARKLYMKYVEKFAPIYAYAAMDSVEKSVYRHQIKPSGGDPGGTEQCFREGEYFWKKYFGTK